MRRHSVGHRVEELQPCSSSTRSSSHTSSWLVESRPDSPVEREIARPGAEEARPRTSGSDTSSEAENQKFRLDSDDEGSGILSLEGLWENWFLKPVSWTHDPESRSSRKVVTKQRLSLRHGSTFEEVDHYVTRLGKALRKQIRGQRGTWVPLTHSLKESFRVLKVLGTGHYGVVLLCEEKETGLKFACKTVIKSVLVTEAVVRELCNEVHTMLRLQQHATSPATRENIVSLHEVIEDQDAVHLIMDYCNGGDLFDFICRHKRISEPVSASILRQVVTAVEVMHSLSILHRDLKPENVFLTSGGTSHPKVKLGDFGLCVNLQGGRKAWGIIGTYQYMAPEVVKQEYYTHKADIWSLGSLLFACLSGHEPFPQKDEREVYLAMSKGVPTFRENPWREISTSARDLVQKMLNPDPVQRIALGEILSHPWMQAHADLSDTPSVDATCSHAMIVQSSSLRECNQRELVS